MRCFVEVLPALSACETNVLLDVLTSKVCLCVVVECKRVYMDRERREEGRVGGEHERSRQEKEARGGWVRRLWCCCKDYRSFINCCI